MPLRLGHDDEQNIGATLLQNQQLPFDSDSSSEGILRYIDQMLMNEDTDDNTHALEASSDFQAKVRSFHELLDQKSPIIGTSDARGYLLDHVVDDQTYFLNRLRLLNPLSSHDHMYSNVKGEAEHISEKLLVVPTEKFDDDVLNVYTRGGREMEFASCFEDPNIPYNKEHLSDGEEMKARNWCGKKKHKGASMISNIFSRK